jgi:threonine/homoserine/homoserine lactone efflux protein
MIGAFLEGINMGLLLCLMIGPVFFALMGSSIDHGFKNAAILAIGVLFSDLVYVGITYFGIHFLTRYPLIEQSLGYVGGLILLGFGARYFTKKVPAVGEEGALAPASKRKAFLQGFGINGINPFVLLFWISIASMVAVKDNWGMGETSLFYLGLLMTVFLTDVGKAFLAGQLAPLMSPSVRKLLNIGVGLLICYFGLNMLWTTWQG